MLTIKQTREFRDWLDHLGNTVAQIRIAARLRLAESGNLGDWKAIDGSLCEMRIHVGSGYRAYFTRRGQEILILLAGGTKSTQRRDIARARKLLAELETNL